MRILILGSGGREHALAWKLSESPAHPEIFIAPGNGGTLAVGRNVDLNPSDFPGIRKFCIENQIEMVIVGPEKPLVEGIYDYFKADPELKDMIITGPSRQGAQLEGSKSFAKSFMKRHHIPTAGYHEFDADNFEEGVQYIQQHSLPIVLKADGLAAGKGVIICQDHAEALREFGEMIHHQKFGESGKKVVIEEFLEGIELSVFICTDGKNYVLFPEAKDYKNIGEGDTGLNTGGMGAISPVPFATESFMRKVTERIIEPTVKGLQQENIDYKGFIFFGLIKVGTDPYVIEYNCRLGDPETEVILLRVKNDLTAIFKAMHEGALKEAVMDIDRNTALTTVIVSGGYPQEYAKGIEVSVNAPEGLTPVETTDKKGSAIIFHAGTKRDGDRLLTNGGRVFAVSACSDDAKTASFLSRETVQNIRFRDMYYRRDIGYEFMM